MTAENRMSVQGLGLVNAQVDMSFQTLRTKDDCGVSDDTKATQDPTHEACEPLADRLRELADYYWLERGLRSALIEAADYIAEAEMAAAERKHD